MIEDDKNNKETIENMLKSCHDSQLYDIVIRDDYRSEYKFEELSEIRIRYLHYHKAGGGDVDFIVTLKNPEDLISATLHKARISNFDLCVNL